MSDIARLLMMHWVELLGYAASALVFATFWMKTLLALRVIAILSNIAFVIYAVSAGIVPILILHTALLPLNLWRVVENIRVYRRIRQAAYAPAEVSALLPLMVPRNMTTGSEIFRKGDTAHELYYIHSGQVYIPEIDKTLPQGTLFGEMGLFTQDKTRTASAICAETCTLGVLDDKAIIDYCLTEPAFGLYLTRLMVGRLAENASTRALKAAE